MAAMNLKIGDHVHYGAHGVCRVCGKEQKNLGSGNRDYYTLRPTGNENILLYLPADAEPEKVKLRELLSRQEALDLIDHVAKTPVQWINDSKLRRETFSKILRSGEADQLLGMLKCIYLHQETLPQGKQLPMSDQEMRQAAQRQLYSELAYVLSLEESQVQPFILSRVQKEKQPAG